MTEVTVGGERNFGVAANAGAHGRWWRAFAGDLGRVVGRWLGIGRPRARRSAAGTATGGSGTSADGGYDLAIVGSGAAAFSAAIRAGELGARVAMVERGTVGGTCVNVGCIPSKAELAAAAQRDRAAFNPFPGVETSADGVDLGALVAGKDEIVRLLRQERYLDLVEHYGFELVRGTAQFADPNTLLVDGEPVRAERYLLATGASPAIPPIEGLTEAGYLTSTTALELTELPRRLAVIGGNYVGLELAQLFSRLGAEVAVIEMLDRIAPFEESEASAILEQEFSFVAPTGRCRFGERLFPWRRRERSRTGRLRRPAWPAPADAFDARRRLHLRLSRSERLR